MPISDFDDAQHTALQPSADTVNEADWLSSREISGSLSNHFRDFLIPTTNPAKGCGYQIHHVDPRRWQVISARPARHSQQAMREHSR
jgi:hypothetical protein